jgi:hypothetical protein
MRDVSELELRSGGQPEFSVRVKPSDISDLESQFQVRLNSQHKEFLLTVSGGFPGLSTLFDDEGNEHDVSVLYAVGSPAMPGEYTLRRALGLAAAQNHQGLYPFAESAGGDSYYLSEAGEVFREMHETNEIVRISTSFSEFIDRLR